MAKRASKNSRYGKTGAFLRGRRIELGLSQREVCQALGIHTSQCISNLERGIALPPLCNLRLIITKYGLTYKQVVPIILEDEKRRLRQLLR